MHGDLFYEVKITRLGKPANSKKGHGNAHLAKVKQAAFAKFQKKHLFGLEVINYSKCGEIWSALQNP